MGGLLSKRLPLSCPQLTIACLSSGSPQAKCKVRLEQKQEYLFQRRGRTKILQCHNHHTHCLSWHSFEKLVHLWVYWCVALELQDSMGEKPEFVVISFLIVKKVDHSLWKTKCVSVQAGISITTLLWSPLRSVTIYKTHSRDQMCTNALDEEEWYHNLWFLQRGSQKVGWMAVLVCSVA